MDIPSFAFYLNERLIVNFDSFIIVDSGAVKGTGKSVFSIKLCKQICKQIDYPYHKMATATNPFTFDLIVFNPTDEKIVELVKKLPDGCPIHIDEASKVAYKRDYQKEYQKNLIKFVNICRKFKKVIILNNPDFWDLDKDLRNLSDFRVVIVKRGLAQVRGKATNPDLKDKWLRDECIKIIDRYTKGSITKLNQTRQGIRKCPNWLYDIPFGDLGISEYQAYEELSKKEEIKSFESNVQEDYKLKLLLTVLLTEIGRNPRDKKLSTIDLTRMLNIILKGSIWSDTREMPVITASRLRLWKSMAKGFGAVAEKLNNNNNL